MPPENYALVADIGGTNARFALVAAGARMPVEPRNLRCAEHPTMVDAIRAYLDLVKLGTPREAAISVASPVTGDLLKMTNHDWSFSVDKTRAALGLQRLKLLNDYTALALSLPVLSPQQRVQIGPGESRKNYPMAVIGPGTGLGVSAILPHGDIWLPLECEGGHVSYGPLNAREHQIIELIREELGHVSAESLVSGPGLTRLHATITRLEGGDTRPLAPAAISDLALAQNCPLASESLLLFCDILGTVAGNLALTLGAQGGIYIGGGIVRKILSFFRRSNFRERFEQHGRMTDYLRAIPTYVIEADYPALTGASISLDHEYDWIGVTSRATRQS